MNSKETARQQIRTNVRGPLFERGWNSLVRTLGAPDAVRFMRAFSQGNGDSVQEFHKLWEGMDVDTIHHRITRFSRKK